jgi:hypothetical protein
MNVVKRARMLHHPESSSRFPNGRSMSRARAPTLHHRAHLATVFGPPARAKDRPSARLPPLGCHRSRIPDRIVFEKLVQILVFGCAYERIADGTCSERTLRRRRDEWIELGVMERLRRICLDAYDRLTGLELSEVAVDGCVTKAPCGGTRRAK